MKKILIGLGALLALVLALLVVLLWRLDSERLGQFVLARVNQAEGVQLEADEVHFEILQGLYLNSARLRAVSPQQTVEAEIEEVLFRYQLLPLLRSQVVIDEIVVRRPVIRVLSAAPEPRRKPQHDKGKGKKRQPPPEAATPGADEGGMTLSVARLQVEDGDLTMVEEGNEDEALMLEGLDVDLTGIELTPEDSTVLGISAAGSLAVETIVTGDLRARDARGRLLLKRGEVEILDTGVLTDNAELTVAFLRADMRQVPSPFSLSVSGGVDLNAVLDFEGRDGLGAAALELEVEGKGSDTSNLVGQGVVHLEDGEIPAISTLVTVETLLGRPLLTGSPYTGTDIRFRIADDLLVLDPFELAGERVRLDTDGTVSFAGPVDLQLAVEMRRSDAAIEEVPEEALDGLTDEAGWVSIPFVVEGSLDEPEVGLDWTSIRDAATGVAVERLGKEAGRLLDRLLGGDDEE